MSTKPFIKAITGLTRGRYHTWQVFQDYCEMQALALSNAVTPNDSELWRKREAQYMAIVRRYEREEVKAFTQLQALLIEALEEEPRDFLGQAFMEMELSSKWQGQFFTPTHLCDVIAEVTVGDELEPVIGNKGYVTVHEPACGGGAMIISLAKVLKAKGYNYQDCLYVNAVDVSPVAAFMAYIQFSFLVIAAEVWIGNTLSMEMREVYYTPMYFMKGWQWRKPLQVSEPERPEADITSPGAGQLELFQEGAA